MEETVGLLWHRLITRAAGGHFPKAAVKLKEIEKVAGVFFRALGGDPGLRVAAATADGHGARRSLLQRIAGADERISRGRMDIATLRLPPEIDALPERGLNRDLYLWLAALAAGHGAGAPEADAATDAAMAPLPDGELDRAATRELRENQRATLRALQRWPGIETRYRRLVDAAIAQRPKLEKLPPPKPPANGCCARPCMRPAAWLRLRRCHRRPRPPSPCCCGSATSVAHSRVG